MSDPLPRCVLRFGKLKPGKVSYASTTVPWPDPPVQLTILGVLREKADGDGRWTLTLVCDRATIEIPDKPTDWSDVPPDEASNDRQRHTLVFDIPGPPREISFRFRPNIRTLDTHDADGPPDYASSFFTLDGGEGQASVRATMLQVSVYEPGETEPKSRRLIAIGAAGGDEQKAYQAIFTAIAERENPIPKREDRGVRQSEDARVRDYVNQLCLCEMSLSQEPRQIMRIHPGSAAFDAPFDSDTFHRLKNSAKLRCYVLRENVESGCVLARVQYEMVNRPYEDVAPAVVAVSWDWAPKDVFEKMTTIRRRVPPVQAKDIRSVEMSGLKGSVRLVRDDTTNTLRTFFPRVLLQEGGEDTELMFTVVERV